MKTHVLVTGGAGYIGSHTCKELSKNGFTPVVFDDLSRGHGNFVKWGPLVKAKLSETPKIVKALREYKIESVLHFAAFAYVGESCLQPALYYENNVMGSLSLLKACQETAVRNFIFSSSCATYGVPGGNAAGVGIPGGNAAGVGVPGGNAAGVGVPGGNAAGVGVPGGNAAGGGISEDQPQLPINPYGHSKLMTERMLRDLSAVTGMKSVCLRYFNAAGSSADLEIGEDHDPEPHLIPNILLNPHNVQIFGNDYDTQDGTCVRDYIHVEDLARAHVQTLQKLMQGAPLRFAYNLGSEKGSSVLEVIRTAEKVMGQKVDYTFTARRPGDPPRLVALSDLAKKDLEFQPRLSLEQMVQSNYDWIQKRRAEEKI